MDRIEKQEMIKTLDSVFQSSELVVLTKYSGLTVAEMTELRGQLRDVGAGIKVVKNRLAKIALKGKPNEEAASQFQGSVAIVYSDDLSSAPKVLTQYAKANDKLSVVGGFTKEARLGLDEIKVLASLPSIDELRAQFVYVLGAPARKMVRILQAPSKRLVRVLERRTENLDA